MNKNMYNKMLEEIIQIERDYHSFTIAMGVKRRELLIIAKLVGELYNTKKELKKLQKEFEG